MKDIFEVIIGAILGACLSYVFFRRKSKDDFSATLFMEYKNITQELAEILRELLPLSLKFQGYTKKQCQEIDKALGVFFFKYYLILPQRVLEEINCLHECLLCCGRNAYIIKKENGVPKLLVRSTDDDIKQLLNEVALVTTRKNLFGMYQQYKRLPNSIYLKCQARHVITTMHDCWNLSNIHEWKKQLTKMTIAQRKKKLK